MNATNRAVNRLFLIVSALVLVAVGAALVALAVVPAVRDAWRTTGEQALTAVDDAAASVPLGDTGVSWLAVGSVAALALVVVLVVVMLARLGGGRVRTILTAPSTLGEVTFATDVARDSLVPMLESSPEVASATVRAFTVRRAPALYVGVTCARGVSPRDAVDLVDRRLEAFDVLLGEERTTLVHLTGGHRAARVTR